MCCLTTRRASLTRPRMQVLIAKGAAKALWMHRELDRGHRRRLLTLLHSPAQPPASSFVNPSKSWLRLLALDPFSAHKCQPFRAWTRASHPTRGCRSTWTMLRVGSRGRSCAGPGQRCFAGYLATLRRRSAQLAAHPSAEDVVRLYGGGPDAHDMVPSRNAPG